MFDLMPTDTADDWTVIATRLKALPERDRRATSPRSARASLPGASSPPSGRCTRSSRRSTRYTGDTPASSQSFAGERRTGRRPASRHPWPRDLSDNANAARASPTTSSGRRSSAARGSPRRPVEKDAVGRELYALHSRRFLGATARSRRDVRLGRRGACPHGGRAGVDRPRDQGQERRSRGGRRVPQPRTSRARLHGTDALQRWIQQTSDRAVAELGKTHFDIPDPIRRLECMIAPTQETGLRYLHPTDDFSRPGRMW